MSSVSNKDLFNFQRVVITFYFRDANNRNQETKRHFHSIFRTICGKLSRSKWCKLNTRQVELHRSKQHSSNSIGKACSIPDTSRLATNVDFFREFYNNTYTPVCKPCLMARSDSYKHLRPPRFYLTLDSREA